MEMQRILAAAQLSRCTPIVSSWLHRRELYQVPSGRYVVYHWCVHNTDYEEAKLIGASACDEFDPPLTLEQLQENFPFLATKAGLFSVRNLEL